MVRRAGEHVPASDTALGAYETGSFQCEEDLLEVRLGKPGTHGDVAHGGRRVTAAVQSQ